MPVIFNYKICDLAPECSGIEVCPTKAIFYNQKTKRPEVDNQKCTDCGACVRACPVGAIILSESEERYQEILENLKNDPRSEVELWKERLGCQPGRTKPLARVITLENFKQEVVGGKGWVALDVWSEDTLDCRAHSVLWEDLGFRNKIALKKLDGGKYPQLANKLKATVFPTLLFLKNGQEKGRREEYVYQKDKLALKKQIKALLGVEL